MFGRWYQNMPVWASCIHFQNSHSSLAGDTSCMYCCVYVSAFFAYVCAERFHCGTLQRYPNNDEYYIFALDYVLYMLYDCCVPRYLRVAILERGRYSLLGVCTCAGLAVLCDNTHLWWTCGVLVVFLVWFCSAQYDHSLRASLCDLPYKSNVGNGRCSGDGDKHHVGFSLLLSLLCPRSFWACLFCICLQWFSLITFTLIINSAAMYQYVHIM